MRVCGYVCVCVCMSTCERGRFCWNMPSVQMCVCVCKTEMGERVCERVRVHLCMNANVRVCARGVLM